MFTVEQHVHDTWHILFRGDRAQACLYWDAVPAGKGIGIVIRGPDGALVRARGGANGDAHRFNLSKGTP